MTLIELLVVVSILLMLALIAIPAVRPGIEGQRTREAARMVNVFVSNARNRAEASGRPYGVEIERLTGLPLASAVLHQVEVPPPYGGDTTTAAVRLQDWTIAVYSPQPVPWWPDGSVVLKVKVRAGEVSPGLVRYGDRIQFNYQGLIYTIVADPRPMPAAAPFVEYPPDANGFINFNPLPPNPAPVDNNGDGFIDNYVFTVCADSRQGVIFPRPSWECKPLDPSPQWTKWCDPAVPFSVFRQPVRTSATPLQLPRGTVIDLAYSGTPSAPSAGMLDLTTSVRILFSPNGTVDRVYWLASGAQRATEPIYLMVGRRTRVSTDVSQPTLSPAEDLLTNLQDLGNFWITIQAQTGLATTADVAAAANATDIAGARSEAATSRPVGGR